MRRSGATELIRCGFDWGSILLFGRWASDKAAREYILGGEVVILQAEEQHPTVDEN